MSIEITGRGERESNGIEDCGHDKWVNDQEDGDAESLGGTCYRSTEYCRICGLKKISVTYGSQRDPGEEDTVEYEVSE